MDVTVIGAGISGLTSAVRLGEAGFKVRVITDRPSVETTSAVAAAIWFPYAAFPLDKVCDWSATAYREFELLASVPEAGVMMVKLLELLPQSVGEPWWASAVPEWRKAIQAELRGDFVDGYCLHAPVVDSSRFLPYLTGRVSALGCRIEVVDKPVKSLSSVEGSILVNCTGLAARELCQDPEVFPIRGQVVRITNPGIEVSYAADDDAENLAYIIPRTADCVLGGTATENDERDTADPEETRLIVERCARLDSRVADAQVLEVKVGLRPGRNAIRLEKEGLPDGRRIIHNYGHGGSGYTLSWGCADEVVELARS